MEGKGSEEMKQGPPPVLEAPVVDEKEEELDEEKLEEIRRKMDRDIMDDLDTMEVDDEGKESGSPSTSSKLELSKLLTQRHINILSDLEERARYIPMRLNEEERVLLKVVEGALDISEYTNKVDVSTNNYYARMSNNIDTIAEEQESICQSLLGLGVCNDYRRFGGSLLTDKEIKDNEDFYQKCLEIGRRYKIMNPDKMRSDYGKLLYVIMDNISPRGVRNVEFRFTRKVKTVYRVLKRAGGNALALLADPLVAIAASEIEPGSEDQIELAQKQKQAAANELVAKYQSEELSKETLMLVISSISDSFSFLRSNRDPVDRMIHYLKTKFNPNVVPQNPLESLAIRGGKGGSKLSHSHETQFFFVLQSLTLWREIMGNFFKLWCLAEEDLLDPRNGYRLCNTGQGIQRCQSAPRVGQEMSRILSVVRAKVGTWIGLSVVHLGDRDVPNALVFIDKYTQVPRLLGPIAHTIDSIDRLCEDPALEKYVMKNFGDAEKLKKLVLADYFKHGFDGSGDDGGSCIDGRLTSTWNWCSKLDKKSFHSIFMLTDFKSFDGSFD